MTWHRTTDLDEFDAAAGALLRSKPVANTIALTLLENLRIRGSHAFGEEDPFFGWWDDGTVSGVTLTPAMLLPGSTASRLRCVNTAMLSMRFSASTNS